MKRKGKNWYLSDYLLQVMNNDWNLSTKHLTRARNSLANYVFLLLDIRVDLERKFPSKLQQSTLVSLDESIRDLKVAIRRIDLLIEKCNKTKKPFILECRKTGLLIEKTVENTTKVIDRSLSFFE